MSARVFVDTNVFVYAVDRNAGEKQKGARAWQEMLWRTRRGRTSFQVLQEFYVQSCRLNPQSKKAARDEVEDLLAWDPVVCDESVLLDAFKAQDRFQLSFWDSLILAAARTAGCRFLLTEDFQEAQNLDDIVVVNPFKTQPGALENT